jgi:hypothetical protein
LKPAQSVPRLRAGRTFSHSTTVTIPSTVGVGSWFVIGCADASRRVRETSDANNCRAAARALVVQEGEP